jgi:hypothetical protein
MWVLSTIKIENRARNSTMKQEGIYMLYINFIKLTCGPSYVRNITHKAPPILGKLL